MQTGDVAGAFETGERSRARSLYDLIRNRLPPGAAPGMGRVPLRDLQKELDPGMVALEYSLGSDASYVFVVTNDSVAAHPLVGRAQIESAARKLYGAWSAHRDSAADCQALSRMLFGSVGDAIRRKRVVVVPDGALAYIPFGGLFGSNGRRIIEESDVVTTVSLSALKLLRDRTRDRQPAPEMTMFAAYRSPVGTTLAFTPPPSLSTAVRERCGIVGLVSPAFYPSGGGGDRGAFAGTAAMAGPRFRCQQGRGRQSQTSRLPHRALRYAWTDERTRPSPFRAGVLDGGSGRPSAKRFFAGR